MKYIKIIATSMLLLGFSNLAAAGTYQSCIKSTGEAISGDYGNNTGSTYNDDVTSCNRTPQWQRLGTEWNSDTDNRSETDPLNTDDGVSYETLIDGDWVTEGDLIAGNTVRFIFDVTRSAVGNHKYDQLKSWVDWDQNGKWEEDETIFAKKWWKNENSEGEIQTQLVIDNASNQDGTKNWDLYNNGYDNFYNSLDTTGTFTSEEWTIPDTLEEILLRARIACENSLESWTAGTSMILLSHGYQDQGETEDHRFTVAKVTVPEPSTIFMFGLGMLALTTRRKSH
jgi:hypothetical protein